MNARLVVKLHGVFRRIHILFAWPDGRYFIKETAPPSLCVPAFLVNRCFFKGPPSLTSPLLSGVVFMFKRHFNLLVKRLWPYWIYIVILKAEETSHTTYLYIVCRSGRGYQLEKIRCFKALFAVSFPRSVLTRYVSSIQARVLGAKLSLSVLIHS